MKKRMGPKMDPCDTPIVILPFANYTDHTHHAEVRLCSSVVGPAPGKRNWEIENKCIFKCVFCYLDSAFVHFTVSDNNPQTPPKFLVSKDAVEFVFSYVGRNGNGTNWIYGTAFRPQT